VSCNACMFSGSGDKGIKKLEKYQKRLSTAEWEDMMIVLTGSFKEDNVKQPRFGIEQYKFIVSCIRPALM
jgi:hypothetical protein